MTRAKTVLLKYAMWIPTDQSHGDGQCTCRSPPNLRGWFGSEQCDVFTPNICWLSDERKCWANERAKRSEMREHSANCRFAVKSRDRVFQIEQNEVLGKNQLQYKWLVASRVVTHAEINPPNQLSEKNYDRSKSDPGKRKPSEIWITFGISLSTW